MKSSIKYYCLLSLFNLLISAETGNKPYLENEFLSEIAAHPFSKSIDSLLGKIQVLGSRSVGTDSYTSSGSWIKQYMTDIGYRYLGSQFFNVATPVDSGCSLAIPYGDLLKNIKISPLWPNSVAIPILPGGKITGNLIYAGSGSIEDFDGSKINRGQTIVLMDYNSKDNWKIAANLGAAAVVYLPQHDASYQENLYKYAEIPLQFPRYYLDNKSVRSHLLELAKNQSSVTIFSNVKWENAKAENILFFLPSSNQKEKETILLHISYDAGSILIGSAHGGQTAFNLAGSFPVLDFLASSDQLIREHNILVFFNGCRVIGNTGGKLFAELLRDQRGRKISELKEKIGKGESLGTRDEWLVKNFPDVVPWVTERSENMYLYLERLNEAKNWLKESMDKDAGEFDYQDPKLPTQLEIVGYYDSYEWLKTILKDYIMERHIESIINTSQLAADYGIDLLNISGDVPKDLENSILKKEFFRQLSKGDEPEEIMKIFRQEKNSVPITSGEFRDYLLSYFDSRHMEIKSNYLMLQGADSIIQTLAGLDINRCIVLDLAKGSTIVSLGYSTGHSSEMFWNIAPLISRELQFISDQANVNLEYNIAQYFDFLDAVTFDESRERKSRIFANGPINLEISQAGISEYRLATGNGADQYILGPGDRLEYDLSDIKEITIQSRTLGLILSVLLFDPDLFVLRSLEYRHRNERVSGIVVKKDIRAGPFPKIPVKNVIVSLEGFFSKAQGSILSNHFSITGTTGMFSFPGLSAEAWKVTVYPKTYTLGAYRLSQDEGMIEVATDQASVGGQSGEYSVNLSQGDVFKRLVVFEGVCIQSYDSIDPTTLLTIPALEPIPAAGRGLDNLFSISDKSDLMVHLLNKNSRAHFISSPSMFLIGPDSESDFMEGFRLQKNLNIDYTSVVAAQNLWSLNEKRIDKLVKRGINNSLLEKLHESSKNDLDTLKILLKNNFYSDAFFRAKNIWGRELRLYPMIRGMVDEAIISVVILLGFIIFCSYFLERILLGSGSANARVIGFMGFFFLGALVLFFLHPAFQLSSSPIIILIAYSLAGFGILTITVILKKYKSVIQEWRIKIGGVHASDVSRKSALMMAFNLGLANMSKRPLRTLLTIITMALLVFSVTTLLSVDRYNDTKWVKISNDVNPSHNGLMLRYHNWLDIPHVSAKIFEEQIPVNFDVAKRNWFQTWQGGYQIGLGQNNYPIKYIKNSTEYVVEYIQGFMPNEIKFSSLPECVIGEWFSGKDDEVILPSNIAQALGITNQMIESGLTPIVNCFNKDYRVIGILDTKLADQTIDISGSHLSHLDYNLSGVNGMVALDENNISKAGTERYLFHYSFEKGLLLPYDVVNNLGGRIKSIVATTVNNKELEDVAQSLMSFLKHSLFITIDDNRYLLKSAESQSITGSHRLIIPILLVVLIMVNTMMNTINERKEEISMLGAIGLSPGHITLLYIAEAAVYGVCGVVFGIFLGLGVGVIFSDADMGLTINYASLANIWIGIFVTIIVLIFTWIPAHFSARSSVPSGASKWDLDRDSEGRMDIILPFNLTDFNGFGVFNFIFEYLGVHKQPTSPDFRCSNLLIDKKDNGTIFIDSSVWIAPYDLGVSQKMRLELKPHKDMALTSVSYNAVMISGDINSWEQANYRFIDLIRKQFLIFRTLTKEQKERYYPN